jgi:hypothetical protein
MKKKRTRKERNCVEREETVLPSSSSTYPYHISTLCETAANLSAIGVGTLISCWPILIICHLTGYEIFALPSSHELPLVLANAALSLSFDFTFALAIYMTSPVIVSVSCALVIPLSFLADYYLHGSKLNVWSCIGAGVVIIGICLLNGDDSDEHAKKDDDTAAVAAAAAAEDDFSDDDDAYVYDDEEDDVECGGGEDSLLTPLRKVKSGGGDQS